jgi:pfkB family carbohydrate kinase
VRNPEEKGIDSLIPNSDTNDCVKPDHSGNGKLSSQAGSPLPHVVVLGEVLWDVFEDSRRLGGAPLNFGIHARRLGQGVTLLSALGADDLGAQAERIAPLGLDTRFLKTTPRFPTGTTQAGRAKTDGPNSPSRGRPLTMRWTSPTATSTSRAPYQP